MTIVQPINAVELALAATFLLFAGGISWALTLGLGKSLLIGAVRTYLQLIALGIVLRWVFANDTPLVIVPFLGVMILIAAQILLGRVKSGPHGLFLPALISISTSGLTVILAVTSLIIHVHPWYSPQYLLPIAGMVLGNSMTGISLALERLFGDLKQRSEEVQVLLALGASPWEACLSSIRSALTAGLIPTINAMNAVGIVSIPGMMTGQIIAGADPGMAARYQIVVMLMLSAATAIGSILSVVLSYRKAFDHDDRFILLTSNL